MKGPGVIQPSPPHCMAEADAQLKARLALPRVRTVDG